MVRAALISLALTLLAVAPVRAATLGERTIGKGDRGSDVITLQRVLSMKGYNVGAADGIFGRRTKAVVKRFQRRRRLTADGRVGPLTTAALAYTWKVRSATYYGPGLYGNRTACGHKLGRRTRGIAHRTLRCGTPVPVYHGGRLAIFPVIDRGPYTDGIALDLTAAAARKVGVGSTTSVRAGY